MAELVEVRDIPLDDLVIGLGQVRVRDVAKEIDELAASIERIGLLEPIVTCPAEENGKYEILTGQRRYLAHRQLNRPTIKAAVLDERVDAMQAKIISLSENLVRRDLHSRDLIDACTALFKKYGSVRAVAEETGLPYRVVSKYVKYDQLVPELKDLVDAAQVTLTSALRAQQAASVSGTIKPDEAVQFAKELSGMSGAQQSQVVKVREGNPERPADEVIEAARTTEKVIQVVVTLGSEQHRRLKAFADDEQTTMDDAARVLIEEALGSRGYMGD